MGSKKYNYKITAVLSMFTKKKKIEAQNKKENDILDELQKE